jgi:hypothetical protein
MARELSQVQNVLMRGGEGGGGGGGGAHDGLVDAEDGLEMSALQNII